MPTDTILKCVQEKLAKQNLILEKFGLDTVRKKQDELCTKCMLGSDQLELRSRTDWCSYSLLPITTEGIDCPYFLTAGQIQQL